MKFFGHFELIDASRTHDQLLLRSTRIENGTVHNTDILFEGVVHLDLAFNLKDPEIRESTSGPQTMDRAWLAHLSAEALKDLHRFEIQAFGREFSVLAERCRYQQNQLAPGETSIAIKKAAPLSVEDIEKLTRDFDLEKWFEANKKKSWLDI